ncbi:MAG TPA: outer membrane beta-barrel protein [Gammaproteobacteria bacterium]|nr:outer membrane beta-barrel protein [Gammaproteobacteria bacterium]
MKRLAILTVLLAPGAVLAQEAATTRPDIGYTYAELRFVDTDEGGGDGLRISGSYDLGNNWLIIGGLTSIDYRGDVDQTILEIGGGYVFAFNEDFDIIASASVIDMDIDVPGSGNVNRDDSGISLSAGVRGLVTPEFEVRGSVTHVALDDSDTYLEIGGDYHFTRQIAAGVSVQLAGDNDLFTVGARWFFR